MCLVVASAICGVSAVVARWKSSNPILSITYSLFVMLHGTWFIQVCCNYRQGVPGLFRFVAT